MTEAAKNDGEAAVIVSLVEAAMEMFTASIEALPDLDAPEFSERALVVLSGLRKPEAAVSEAADRPRVTPSVIIALSGLDEVVLITMRNSMTARLAPCRRGSTSRSRWCTVEPATYVAELTSTRR
jgi:hypothetical protein